MLLLIAALQAGVPAEDAFARRAWGRISRSAALAPDAAVIEMAMDGYYDSAKRREQTFRLTSWKFDEPPKVRWASSRTCPAVRQVAALADFPMPRPQPFAGDISDFVPPTDGVSYVVSFPVGYGTAYPEQATLRSKDGTPLATWVDGVLTKLEPCWSTTEPKQAP